MKTFLRNLRRMTTAYLLNIVGLTVAFAAFCIIMIQVRHEFSFDRNTPEGDCIFRAELTLKDNMGAIGKAGQKLPIFSRAWSEEIIHSSPMIESGVVLFPYMDLTYITIDTPEGQKGFKVDFEPCSPDIYKTFHFEMVEGVAECLDNPDQVLLPKSLAKTLFGNESALGKQIRAMEYIWQRDNYFLNVGGVYKDFKDSQLKNSIYVPLSTQDISRWGGFNYLTYLKLKSPEMAAEVVENYERVKSENPNTANTTLSLRPLKDIYFTDECIYDDRSAHGSLSTTLILLSIGILIIILATINFTNFSMALVPFRIKSINTKKVLGSSDAALRKGLVIDAVWTTFISSLFSVLLVFIIGKSGLREIASCPIGILQNWDIVLGTILLSIIIGIFAGIYPARYSTSFSPALVLKGSFGLSPKGLLLRKILVAIQFIISLSLISCSLLIQKQNRYMQSGDLGFDKENLYLSDIQSSFDSAQFMSITQKLYELPYVVDVAFAQDKLCSKDNYQRYSFEHEGEKLEATVMFVSWNYLKTIGIKLNEGSYPTEADWLKSQDMIFPNKAFKEANQLTLESVIDGGEEKIMCFTDDPMIFSLKKNPDPALMYTRCKGSTTAFVYIYVRVVPGTDPQQAISEINTIISEPEPTYPVSLQPFTSILEQRFESDLKFEKGIKAFSILAIIISMIGVFGLVLFDTQQRSKEIAVRRVHGANENDVLIMFTKPYLLLLAICFVLSVPIVLFIGRTWLSNFANKVSISPWIFVISLAITLIITLSTIIFQVLRAVRNNPVDSIKIE